MVAEVIVECTILPEIRIGLGEDRGLQCSEGYCACCCEVPAFGFRIVFI